MASSSSEEEVITDDDVKLVSRHGTTARNARYDAVSSDATWNDGPKYDGIPVTTNVEYVRYGSVQHVPTTNILRSTKISRLLAR